LCVCQRCLNLFVGRFEKREASLGKQAAETKANQPSFFIHSPLESRTSLEAAAHSSSRNADYLRSIANRKCREDLLEMRSLNSVGEEQAARSQRPAKPRGLTNQTKVAVGSGPRSHLLCI